MAAKHYETEDKYLNINRGLMLQTQTFGRKEVYHEV